MNLNEFSSLIPFEDYRVRSVCILMFCVCVVLCECGVCVVWVGGVEGSGGGCGVWVCLC